MDRLAQALAWSKFAPVFPAHERDTWVGRKFHGIKTPATINGHLDGTQDEDKIRRWWSEAPGRLVGVWLGEKYIVLDVDVDLEKTEDGFHYLEEKSLVCPESYVQDTPSGGQHIFYRNPGAPLRPRNNYRAEEEGARTGLDRKTGSSYVIAYSATPPQPEELADAPSWLLEDSPSVRQNEYSGTLEDWLKGLNQSAADYRVIDAIRRFPTEDFDHQVMITKQTELVLLGAQSHPGVEEAIDLLHALWTFGKYDTEEYQLEWTAALEGAVRKFGGQHHEGETK
jgi:hypothetical protein